MAVMHALTDVIDPYAVAPNPRGAGYVVYNVNDGPDHAPTCDRFDSADDAVTQAAIYNGWFRHQRGA